MSNFTFPDQTKKAVAAVLMGATALSLLVVTVAVTRVRNTANQLSPEDTQAALACQANFNGFDVPLSNCNEGCFKNSDCVLGLACSGAVGTTTLGKCVNLANPAACGALTGKGDVSIRAYSTTKGGTFSFKNTWPAGSDVGVEMGMPAQANNTLTTNRFVYGSNPAMYYSTGGPTSIVGWFKAGAVVYTEAQQPPAGFCLVDTGTLRKSNITKVWTEPMWSGKACRRTKATVQNHVGRRVLFKYGACTTSNWASTNCESDITFEAPGLLYELSLNVTNTATTDATFRVTGNGVLADLLSDSQVAGVTSATLADPVGNTAIKVKAGTTQTVDFDIYAESLSGFTLIVDSGAIKLNSASLYDVEHGTTKTGSSVNVQVVKPGQGLKGDYYGRVNFTDFRASRVDQNVNFDWGIGKAIDGLGAADFSVRWTGFVTAPVTGEYTFYTQHNDGARLWINNTQLVNDWVERSTTAEKSGKIRLEAGRKYSVKMEMFDHNGPAVSKLLWSYSGVSKTAVPGTNLSTQ